MPKKVRIRRARIAKLASWIEKGRRPSDVTESAKRFAAIAFA